MRVAVISDIHGNAPALEAVLADIDAQSVDALLNLGDHFYGPLEPQRTADLLLSRQTISILGNTDRYILDAARRGGTLDTLPPAALDWLKSLPSTATFDDQIFLCHGTPASDDLYWLDCEKHSGFRAASFGEVAAHLPSGSFPLYCCGHTHIARVVSLPDGRIVFNPGSVGRPSFNMQDADSACRASPAAAYALLTHDARGWVIDLRQIPYDHEKSAAIALANGSHEWAQDLREGRRR